MLLYTKAGHTNGILIFKAHIQERTDNFGHLERYYIEEKEASSLFDQERPYDLVNLCGSGS